MAQPADPDTAQFKLIVKKYCQVLVKVQCYRTLGGAARARRERRRQLTPFRAENLFRTISGQFWRKLLTGSLCAGLLLAKLSRGAHC